MAHMGIGRGIFTFTDLVGRSEEYRHIVRGKVRKMTLNGTWRRWVVKGLLGAT